MKKYIGYLKINEDIFEPLTKTDIVDDINTQQDQIQQIQF